MGEEHLALRRAVERKTPSKLTPERNRPHTHAPRPWRTPETAGITRAFWRHKARAGCAVKWFDAKREQEVALMQCLLPLDPTRLIPGAMNAGICPESDQYVPGI